MKKKKKKKEETGSIQRNEQKLKRERNGFEKLLGTKLNSSQTQREVLRNSKEFKTRMCMDTHTHTYKIYSRFYLPPTDLFRQTIPLIPLINLIHNNHTRPGPTITLPYLNSALHKSDFCPSKLRV